MEETPMRKPSPSYKPEPWMKPYTIWDNIFPKGYRIYNCCLYAVMALVLVGVVWLGVKGIGVGVRGASAGVAWLNSPGAIPTVTPHQEATSSDTSKEMSIGPAAGFPEQPGW